MIDKMPAKKAPAENVQDVIACRLHVERSGPRLRIAPQAGPAHQAKAPASFPDLEMRL